MLVKFSSTFIQSNPYRRYRKGVHEVPDELKGKLPKSATIISEKQAEEEAAVEEASSEPMTLSEGAKLFGNDLSEMPLDESAFKEGQIEKKKPGRPRKE
jgi:hypothetical protein